MQYIFSNSHLSDHPAFRQRDTDPIAQQLERNIDDLKSRWPICVRGSWANREYHLIRHQGSYASLSDLDLVSDNELDLPTRDAISSFIKERTSVLRNEPTISFRTVDELGEVYKRERDNTPLMRSRSESERLVMFWLSIGVAESCYSMAKYSDFQGCDVKAYFLNKMYLNGWRMVHHVAGRNLRSYTELLAATQDLGTDTKNTSLLLKMGANREPNTSAALGALSASLMDVLLRLGSPRDRTKRLYELGADNPSTEKAVKNALATLTIAGNYAQTSSDASVIRHSARKIATIGSVGSV